MDNGIANLLHMIMHEEKVFPEDAKTISIDYVKRFDQIDWDRISKRLRTPL